MTIGNVLSVTSSWTCSISNFIINQIRMRCQFILCCVEVFKICLLISCCSVVSLTNPWTWRISHFIIHRIRMRFCFIYCCIIVFRIKIRQFLFSWCSVLSSKKIAVKLVNIVTWNRVMLTIESSFSLPPFSYTVYLA